MTQRLWDLRREPLVHFLIGGLAIFLFFAWRGTEADPASRTIVIERAEVERMAAQFAQTYRRPPQPDEIDGLIRDFLKEEVYSREAVRLGLDLGDAVIRQRLRQKMEYIARSSAESAQPGDADLQKMLDANPLKYVTGAIYSFDQVYLGDRESSATTSAAQIKARLARGGDWQDMGEPLSAPRSMERANASQIERQFGDRFAGEIAALGRASDSVWSGPLASGYGYHLVRLRASAAPAPAKLAEVRQQVENDWRAATIASREAAAYQALLDGYTVRIEKP